MHMKRERRDYQYNRSDSHHDFHSSAQAFPTKIKKRVLLPKRKSLPSLKPKQNSQPAAGSIRSAVFFPKEI